MLHGAPASVLVCIPAAETAAPCPAGHAPAVMNAYLIADSAQQQLEASFAPVDFAEASSFWALAFVVCLTLWSLTHVFSSTRRAIR